MIYNPSWTKPEHFVVAVDFLNFACEKWNLPRPLVHAFPRNGSTHHIGTGGRFYGEWVAPDNIYVNVAAATVPPKTRGYVWSYPGHKTDRTVSGILFHELGHHCAYAKHIDSAVWKQVVSSTKPVTSYEPVPSEAFAESMRIFIGNPDLLRLARPKRYAFIREYFEPLHDLTWQEVLINAPDFIVLSATVFVDGMDGA